MLPSGVSQLVEQSVKLVLGLYLSRVLLPYGVKYAVAGALVGVTASELLALAYLAVRFFVTVKKRARYLPLAAAPLAETAQELSPPQPIDTKPLLKELFSFALSVTLGSLVLPVTQIIDSALVINMLAPVEGRDGATAAFGLLVGPVGTLINMPTVVALSVAVATLPAVTSAVARGESGVDAARGAAKLILLFTVPVAVAFAAFPQYVCGALYRRGLTAEQLDMAAQLLRIQSIGVLYIGILQFVTTLLQAHNRAHVPVINLLIGACVKVGLTPILVRAFGIAGAACATTACYAVAATLSARSASKMSAIGLDVKNAFIKPLVATLPSAAAFIGVAAMLRALGVTAVLWQAVAGGAAFAAVYAAIVVLTGAVDVRAAIAKLRTAQRSKASEKSGGE